MILLAGVAAGALNAVGGGGSFVALSALVATGMPPVTANATTTVALLPGNATSAWVYRREIEGLTQPSPARRLCRVSRYRPPRWLLRPSASTGSSSTERAASPHRARSAN